MRRYDLFALAVLCLLFVLMAGLVQWTERAYLPRHSGAIDAPFAADPFAQRAAEGVPLNSAFSDKVNLIWPDQVFAHREFHSGRMATWNPHALSGVPHAANPLTRVFYPPQGGLLFLEPLDGLLWDAALHAFLFGAFTLLFLRRLGCRSSVALCGGLGIALSGWVAAHLHNTPLVATFCWTPLALFAVESRLLGRGRGYIATAKPRRIVMPEE